jgi:hypothetical protein
MFGSARATPIAIYSVVILLGSAAFYQSSAEELCSKMASVIVPVIDVVEIPIRIEFDSPNYRTDWIYESLHPTIHLSQHYYDNNSPEFYDKKVEDSRIDDGALLSTFCMWLERGQRITGDIILKYGAREMALTPRYIDWSARQEVPSRSEGKPPHFLFKMQQIAILKQPDPNWVILKGAKFVKDASGTQLLEVEIYNPLRSDSPGFDVVIESHSTYSCAGPGGTTVEIPVTFSEEGCASKFVPISQEKPISPEDASCKIKAFAPDPGDTRALTREIHGSYGSCGKFFADLHVGPTGGLQNQSVTKLRYVFKDQRPSLEEVMQGDVARRDALFASFGRSAPRNVLLVSIRGGVIFPSSVNISGMSP